MCCAHRCQASCGRFTCSLPLTFNLLRTMATLTIPLAVISLATAVKDLVEVAQQIRDAFKQVPENYRKASEMAEEILRFAEDIKLLYEEEKDVFNRKSRFNKSVEGLLREMNNVKDQCTKLVPPRSVKKRDRFKIAFYAFWNREKVTSLVSELRIQTDRCYNQFLVASNIRIEANVDRITQTVQSFSTNIVSSTADTQLIRFMQSCSPPVTWMRGTIPEPELRSQYITMELGSYRRMAETYMSKYFQTPSTLTVDSISRLTRALSIRPFSELEYHEQVVQQIFSARGMLRDASPADFVGIIYQAYSVALALYRCGIFHESATVVEWAIRAFRHMTCILPSNDAIIYLAACMEQNALYLIAVAKFDEAWDCVNEGIHLAESLILKNQSSPPILAVMADLTVIQSRLATQMTRQSGSSSCIELACRAVQLAEQSIIDSCSLLPAGKSIDLHSFSALTNIMDAANVNPDHKQDLSGFLYGLLNSLKCVYETSGYNDAHIRRRAMDIVRLLLPLYPDSARILRYATFFLRGLYSDSCEPVLARVEYAKECVNIYRRLFQLSKSSRYILPLSEALLSYSNLLSSVERHRESEVILHEVTNLSKTASQTYFVMSLPSITEGDYYLHIAEVYDKLGRWQDAIHATRNAATQYSGLQIIDRDWDPVKHLKSLEMLCRLFYDSGQYQSALLEGRKAFSIVEILTARNSEIITDNIYHPLSKIFTTLKNLRAVSGMVTKASPSFKNITILFESELATPTGLYVYAKSLLALPLVEWSDQLDAPDSITHAIYLVDELIHHPDMRDLKVKLTQRHIDILFYHYNFQETFLQHLQDFTTIYSKGSGALEHKLSDWHSQALFWYQIYVYNPPEAIALDPLNQKRTYPRRLLVIALFDAGKVEEGLSRIQEAIGKEDDETKVPSYLWLASQLYFVMKNYSDAGRIVDGEVAGQEPIRTVINFNDRKSWNSIYSIEELSQILFAGLLFCCSGDHEKGREALSAFARYIKDMISASGLTIIPFIRRGLNAEKKRGKWKLIQESAEAALQCDHMKLVLNGSWVEIAAPHL